MRVPAPVACLLIALACASPQAGTAPDSLAAADRLFQDGDAAGARAAYRALAAEGDPLAREMLAAMLIKGLGGPADWADAMGWLCLRAHDPRGGPAVVKAMWYLAEYFRTGGGLPGGQSYLAGVREAENPLRAYFWFSVLAAQGRFFTRIEDRGVSLGRIGAASVARELRAGERAHVDRVLQGWSPASAPATGERCLAVADP